ncbi:MAG: GNAT family N-acetyltransferase [Rhodospirillaceae bacterium]|nr:GNAT family N-acetyltransferase [Rhodospirillaceae bacterium]
MSSSTSSSAALRIVPATPDRWDDFETLFGPRGASSGCWCMFLRVRRAEWEKGKGEGNRLAIKHLIEAGEVPGLLAYDGDEAVGWCSIAPRAAFPGLGTSRILKPVDDRPVWSIHCFFIRRSHRGTGVSQALLHAACDFARARGAEVVEGYPVDPAPGRYPAAYAWHGFASAFRKAGFTECLRRSDTRPIMRRSLAGG